MRRGVALLLLVAAVGCGTRRADDVAGQSSPSAHVAGQSDGADPPRLFPEEDAARAAVRPTIRLLYDADNPREAVFEVADVAERDLAELTGPAFDSARWPEVFSIVVMPDEAGAGRDRPPVVGQYQAADGRVRFRPRYPLEPGLGYRATFDPARIYTGEDTSPVANSTPRGAADRAPVGGEFAIPKPAVAATTTVTRVFPSARTLPENQLKFYIHFSAPMSRGEGYRHVRLLDASGRAVDLPFLELDEELWDPAGTRFTLFFDPGRIKRGLKPREEVGPVLEEGKRYTLVIDRGWRDARGQPLVEPFRKEFDVGPPDDVQPDQSRWKVLAPAPGSDGPVTIVFPEPLDHAMLQRVLAVVDADGRPVRGAIRVDLDETRWRFTPSSPWQAGEYAIHIVTSLEDLAGNSIARVFEVDELQPIQRELAPETVNLTFRVGD